MIRRYIAYTKYVLQHKLKVYKVGRQLGVPLLRLLLHDISKFYPDEFFPYARTFFAEDGAALPYQMPESPEFLRAWALHQKRNSHHWQYHLRLSSFVPLRTFPDVLIMDRGDYLTTGGILIPHETFSADEMPIEDLREMLADWLSFGDAKTWYAKTKDTKILHPNTRAFLEALLEQLD